VIDVTSISISYEVATDRGAILEAEPRNVVDNTLVDGGLDQGEQSP